MASTITLNIEDGFLDQFMEFISSQPIGRMSVVSEERSLFERQKEYAQKVYNRIEWDNPESFITHEEFLQVFQ